MQFQSLDGTWSLAADSANAGRDERWFGRPELPQAVAVRVPGIIQQSMPGYHGVVWYARDFTPYQEPFIDGVYLLRFGEVDYLAEVWLNGVHVGGHEGAEMPFTLDVTGAIRREQANHLVVRVLNPTQTPIDGVRLEETPHRNKVAPYRTGSSFNCGGLMQPVDLHYVPALRIADVYARPEPKNGLIDVRATIENGTSTAIRSNFRVSVSPAAGGGMLAVAYSNSQFLPGQSTLDSQLRVMEPRLWSVDDPYLYRVTARLEPEHAEHDEYSVQAGFREFHFEEGYFRLNGKRLFLRSAHTGNEFPVGMHVPLDRELLRRDLYYAKTAGFNMVRFIAGVPQPAQLDLCDELGLLVYDECYASWCMADSPYLAERFNRATMEMIRRDRNHASVVIWGLLNETSDGAVFRHAAGLLPVLKLVDDTRMYVLNSGRWDCQRQIGSLSNPGAADWETVLGAENAGAVPLVAPETGRAGYFEGAGDAHYYPPIPLSTESVHFFRTLGHDTKRVFLSEHGNGSSVDVLRVLRLFEQMGAAGNLEDYAQWQAEAEQYLRDWERFGLKRIFASPGDLQRQSQRMQAELRAVALNAIRSNPDLVGYSITGLVDQGMTAEGLWTTFREFKPGMLEAIRDGWAPLRWCAFVEPVNGYRDRPFLVEVVLANEDVLRAGDYPVRLRIAGPTGVIWAHALTLHIPAVPAGRELPLALPVFAGEVSLDGPAGAYELVVECERGAAPAGGRTRFFAGDSAALPTLPGRITTWADEGLAGWLAARGATVRPFAEPALDAREVIAVGDVTGVATMFRELARRVAQGSTAVFLASGVFRRADDAAGWLPLSPKGVLRRTQSWAAARDDFALPHPVFESLPAGGLLDPVFYRDIIPSQTFDGQADPQEVVAGAVATGYYHEGGYYSGTHVTVYPFGAGRFILNTFPLIENLGNHPGADRLVTNLLRYAARDLAQPSAPLPDSFEQQLIDLGYGDH